MVGLRRLSNSMNGNPRYRVRIYKIDETIDLVTKSDGQIGYYIDNHKIGEWLNFEVSGIKRQAIVAVTL
jgi:hypothetical protein